MVRRGFLTVAVSGSPIEVIAPLKELGFQKVFGTEMEVRRGRYTGKVVRNLILAEEKQKLVASLVTRYRVDASLSWAFGDTEQDLPMWRTVGNPVVLNPRRHLRAYAVRRGWMVPSQVVKEVRARLAEG
jgi:phosphoserine phosphatase